MDRVSWTCSAPIRTALSPLPTPATLHQYLAGKELPLENGLPLGLSPESTCAESTFQLALGQQLTLLTDGVVEARDKTGELFGFERTAALSIQPAETIAETAKAFGQDDDITVLIRSYTGVPAFA